MAGTQKTRTQLEADFGGVTKFPTSQQFADLIASFNNILDDPAPAGDVTGPVSAVDSSIVVFDGASGKLVKDSGQQVSKLAGIEAGAEVNQTDAEIKTQYENNADTNEFSDAEKTKLVGIETGATVGDVDAIHDNAAGEIAAIVLKAAPTVSDLGVIEDAAAGNAKKRATLDSWVPPDSVSDAKLRDSAALSVMGRASNSAGDPADIAAASDGQVFLRAGTSLVFGQVVAAGITDGTITNAKMSAMGTQNFKARNSAGNGSPENISAATARAMLNVEDGATNNSSVSATATVQTSTTSSTYVAMSGMTLTPAAGTYIAVFSASGTAGMDAQAMQYAIFSNGSIVAHSQRGIGGASHKSLSAFTMHSHANGIVLNGSQAVDVRFNTDADTFFVDERSLILIKVA